MSVLRSILFFVAGFSLAYLSVPVLAVLVPEPPSVAPMILASAWTALLFSIAGQT